MSKPCFSVIIPSLNRAHVIGLAIESCLKQTCQDFEIIVIDDERSTDDMSKAVSPYLTHCVITLITDHVGSAAAARNTGVRYAAGEYIAFLDADDTYMPTKLATVAESISGESKTLFYSQNYVKRGVGKWWVKPHRGLQEEENIFTYLFLNKGWIHPSSIVLATELARQNPFDTTLSFGDDTQFVASLWMKGIAIKMIDLPLTVYDDPFEANRLSQSPIFSSGESDEHRSFMAWVESHKHEMPESAYRAYRASFRSRFFARSAPAKALEDIWQAWRYDVFSLGQCLNQTLQTFSPHAYRLAADFVVRFRGIDPLKNSIDTQ